MSLHRSEGFGLTLAECMALGKPVIATAFSAATDFMTPGNSYPVDYAITRVGGDCEIYPADGTWAEPDVDEAAQLMRVCRAPGRGARQGRAGAGGHRGAYTPERVGQIARQRLRRLAR